MRKIESTVPFPSEIPCHEVILGKKYDVVISGFKGKLAMPNKYVNDHLQIPNDCEVIGFERKLPPPDNSLVNRFRYDWGNMQSVGGSVRRCVINFELEKNEELQNSINQLSLSTRNYIRTLFNILEVLLETAMVNNSFMSLSMKERVQYFMINDANEFQVAENLPIELSVTFGGCIISNEIFENAIKYANTGLSISTPYNLLRDAYNHKAKNEYRRSVLDASTAIEIAFTSKILTTLENKNITDESLKRSILNKYHSVRGRVELLRSLEVILPCSPKDYSNTLSEIRNKSIHGGYVPTLSEVDEIINIARRTLNEFCEIIDSSDN